LESFHSDGTTPDESDKLKRLEREAAITAAVLRSIWLERPLGPDVVFIFNVQSEFLVSG